ncbi:EmrB/QacA subfamily drug resistance transporter [Actinocorallia herbida]|uniref:EmrB/QacA subfamily drug resistance transporter n=1 Tax=Actinocorallia herbida TaxID=58109 RepID=A0A3N1CNM4_9ACTN|nr:MFS transporter [Actinocorallia herbida]ROO82805.1 EmrB/QacA subfamily drug resistance transporter [Actinocorallia herbida]
MNLLGERRRWWVLGALVLAQIVVALDLTALNIALPVLARDLGAGTGGLQWIIDSYTLVSATLLIPAGLASDRYGRKKMLAAGLAVFLGGSLMAALSSATGTLIAARTLMGVGSAVIIPMSLTVLLVVFPAAERAKAQAAYAAASFLGLPLGPLVGGWLLDRFWWGSVFVINIPIALLALVAVLALVPESRSTDAPRLDAAGVLLSTGGLAALIYGFIEQPVHGWAAPQFWGPVLAGAAALALFWTRTRRSADPLVDLTLFRDRAFAAGTIAATALTFVLFGVLFVVPQYFQGVLGAGTLGSGLRLLPMIGGLVVAARLGTKVAEKAGERAALTSGLAIIALAMAAGTLSDSGYGLTAAWLTLFGLGSGLVLPTAMSLALSALDVDRAGAGSGLLMTVRMVGGAFGAAILGSVLAAASGGVDPSAVAADPAGFLDGMDAVLWTCCAVAVSALAATAAVARGTSAGESDHGTVLLA